MMINRICFKDEFSKQKSDRHEEKLKRALAHLGDKWVLHPSHSPKNKKMATAAANQFLVK